MDFTSLYQTSCIIQISGWNVWRMQFRHHLGYNVHPSLTYRWEAWRAEPSAKTNLALVLLARTQFNPA